MSSDKPLPITLTGVYRGYTVSIQVDSTLAQLDKLVDRLQQRGVSPLHQAAAPAQSSSARRPLETLEGAYQHHWFREPGQRGPVCKLTVKLDDGTLRQCDFWTDEPRDLFALGQGARIRLYGHTKARVNALDNKQYVNFAVSRWEAA